MKILILISSLNHFGGSERVSTMLANSLSTAGYEVIFASIAHSDNPFFPVNKEIKIISLSSFENFRLLRVPNTIYKLRKLLKKEQIDTLIVVDTACIHFTLPAVLGLPIKHICWEHFNFNNDLGSKKRRMDRHLAARYSDVVVTLTERDRSYWLQGTQHNSQIVAIANPCPFPVQTYVKKENTKVVLAIGRLVDLKGFDMLLESWVKVAEVMPNWTLKIVGEGEGKAKLTQFIKENELTDSVELVGTTTEVSRYYKEAEIFCLSSRFEGFPMVLLEALAFGLPIVSFDCDTGPAEVLENTDSILVPQSDIKQLATSLITMMGNDEHRKNISVKSKEKAEVYQPENIISQWIDLIESL